MKNIFLLLLFLAAGSFSARAQIISTVVGGDSTGLGDGGLAIDCELLHPISVALDGTGNYYITDRDHNRIRKVDVAGIITTIAGTGTAGFSGENGPATAAEISAPYGIAIDLAGNIYFSDDGSGRIRKINTSGIITTIAGTGGTGYNGNNIPATSAEFNGLGGIAVDASGNIFVTDDFNFRIRKINTSGIITTVAGTGNPIYNGDGIPATSANLGNLNYVVLDNSGNMYIVDYGQYRIRKVDASGIITTVAGNGTRGATIYGIMATQAELYSPIGVATDNYGNIYISDESYNNISKVSNSGIIILFAGYETGGSGYSGDNGPATLAMLNSPVGMAIDEGGDMYIADAWNERIRYITNTVAVNAVNNPASGVSVYPNPCNGDFTVKISSAIDEQARIVITNIVGQQIKEVFTTTNKPLRLHLDERSRLYFISATTAHGTWTEKIVVTP